MLERACGPQARSPGRQAFGSLRRCEPQTKTKRPPFPTVALDEEHRRDSMLQDLCLRRSACGCALVLLVADVFAQIFLDAGRLAFEATQVVELGTADLAATLHGDGVDRR